MATPSPATPASAPKPPQPKLIERIRELVTPFLAPYYLTVAAVLGAITVGFAIVFVLLAIVTANFNVLGWME